MSAMQEAHLSLLFQYLCSYPNWPSDTALCGTLGVILFKETLYQTTANGKPFVQSLQEQGIYAGIKVDEVRSILQ